MRFPTPLKLVGSSIALHTFMSEDISALAAIGRNYAEEFTHTSTPTTPEQCEVYFDALLQDMADERAYGFTLHHPQDGIIGTSRYNRIMGQKRQCEIGYTWLSPTYYGTGINVEAKLLMLRYLFEQHDWLRVRLNTDVRNRRSQAAIQGIGAVYEGILRADGIRNDGTIRDTMVFSIIHSDWQATKRHIEARLAAKRAN